MKKILFVTKKKLDFNSSNLSKVAYQDIVDSELLSIKSNNSGLDIELAEELVSVDSEFLIIPFWADYNGS